MQVCGADKIWRQFNRDGVPVAHCTVEPLMKRSGLEGAQRAKVARTTVQNKALPCPLDRVNREFKADRPNRLWVSDFTYVSTWQGWLYVTFVIDVFARRIADWRIGSRGDSCDNARAETIDGLYKAELIRERAPWKSRKAVGLATLEWVSWFSSRCLLESIRYIRRAVAE